MKQSGCSSVRCRAGRLAGLLLLHLALFPPALSADNRLQPFLAEYDLLRGALKLGEARVQLELEGDRYHYHSLTRATGIAALIRSDSVSESSKGRILPDGTPQPLDYRYLHQENQQRKREMHIQFDPSRQRASHLLNDQPPWSLKLPVGAQDKMSAQLMLMHATLSGLSPIRFAVAAGGKLRHYSYRAAPEAHHQTVLGNLPLQPQHREIENDSVRLTLWLSPAHNQLPILVERSDADSDDVYRLRLTRLSLNGKSLPTQTERHKPLDILDW
jgi:hypothetical protein